MSEMLASKEQTDDSGHEYAQHEQRTHRFAAHVAAYAAKENTPQPVVAAPLKRPHGLLFGILAALSVFGILLSLSWSSVRIPLDEVVRILVGQTAAQPTWQTIVIDIRVPRVITAMLVGTALGLAGLQMQTIFRNPLAEPFTLGVSSGASLGVALMILAAPSTGIGFSGLGGGVVGNLSTVSSAILGGLLVLGIMLAVAARVRDMTVILLLGVILSALAYALVTVLIFFANERQTRSFIEWQLGSFTRVRWEEIQFFVPVVLIGVVIAFLTTKHLNALLLGESYAQSMGLNIRRARWIIMGSASIMAGAVVAYAGPISFLGIAIPHLARGVFRTSDHRTLVPATVLIGIPLALACGILAEVPSSSLQLPIDAASSLFGAPIAVWVLLRMKRGAWM